MTKKIHSFSNRAKLTSTLRLVSDVYRTNATAHGIPPHKMAAQCLLIPNMFLRNGSILSRMNIYISGQQYLNFM